MKDTYAKEEYISSIASWNLAFSWGLLSLKDGVMRSFSTEKPSSNKNTRLTISNPFKPSSLPAASRRAWISPASWASLQSSYIHKCIKCCSHNQYQEQNWQLRNAAKIKHRLHKKNHEARAYCKISWLSNVPGYARKSCCIRHNHSDQLRFFRVTIHPNLVNKCGLLVHIL